MNFYGLKIIIYFMPKKKIAIFLIIIIALIITVPILGVTVLKKETIDEKEGMQNIVLWQIDGFEGGKGSRKQFLQNKANACFKNQRTYLTVTAITADAARANIADGRLPDMISYPAGFYGIENCINAKDFNYLNWCRGGYCLLTVDSSADFSDVNAENTVINSGKDNLSGVAATFCGLGSANYEPPTNAYLQLITGKRKYLFGTQRDVFRLKTRNVSFSIKPITQFNDLYQNISIITKDSGKYKKCLEFCRYLTQNESGVGKLGLFYKDSQCETAELKEMSICNFDYSLRYPCSESFIDLLKTAAKNNDVNKLKNLLK